MPGAASLIAANNVYSVAKPDGLTIGNFISTLIMSQVLGQEEVNFDIRKFEMLGSPDPRNDGDAVQQESQHHGRREIDVRRSSRQGGCDGVR